MSLKLDFTDQVLLDRGWVLMTFTSRNFLGEPTFAYLITSEAHMDQLVKDSADHDFIDIARYGHVVHEGGGAPTQEDQNTAVSLANQWVENL